MPPRSHAALKRRRVVARIVSADQSAKPTEDSVDQVLPVSTSLDDVFKATGRSLVESAMDGTNASLMMYGRLVSGKGNDTLGTAGKSMLQQTAYVLFDASDRLQEAMNSCFTFQLSVVDIHGNEVYDLGVGFPSTGDSRPFSAGSVLSEPSVTGLVAGSERKDVSEEDLAKFRGSTIQLKKAGEGYEAKKLAIKTVNSKEEMVNHVQTALAFRDSCAPYDPDAAHTVVKIQIIRDNPVKVLPEPITGCFNLVDLATEDHAVTPGKVKDQGENIARDFKALSTVLNGSSQAKTALHDSPLTKFLSSSLMGTAETTLVAHVAADSSLQTMEFARSCMALETRAAVASRPGSDYVVVDHEGVVAKMARENEHLRHQLTETNSHYQQLLMTHAPHALPRGVVETADGFTAAEEADFFSDNSDAEGEDEALPPDAKPAAAAGAPAAPDKGYPSRPPSTASSRAISVVRSVTSIRSAGKSTSSAATRALEAKIRDLEEQLERQKHRNGTLEVQVGDVKEQLTDIKESRMQADHLHYKQSKKLTEQAKLLTEQGNAKEEQMIFQLNSERENANERIQTLKDENGTLRREFSNIMQSIPRFIDTRTKEVADEKDFRTSIRTEAQGELKRHVEVAEANAERQVANLRAQSEYLLAQKNKQIERITADAEVASADAAAQVASLQQELEYVYEYANRLATVVENVEAGKYSIKALKGKKVYQIPNHSKPVPLNMDRMSYLAKKMAQTAKFTETTLPGDGDSNPGSPRNGAARTTEDDDDDGNMNTSQSLAELTDAHKREIEAQVMGDLAANETVQYIRSLEADSKRYRQELHTERKKIHDLRVALGSTKRVTTPNPWEMSIAPGTRDYRNLSTSAPVSFPSKWGNPLGVTDSSGVTGVRPGTAPEHLKTLQRPVMVSRASTPGLHTTKFAGSTFGYRSQMGSSSATNTSKLTLPAAGRSR